MSYWPRKDFLSSESICSLRVTHSVYLTERLITPACHQWLTVIVKPLIELLILVPNIYTATLCHQRRHTDLPPHSVSVGSGPLSHQHSTTSTPSQTYLRPIPHKRQMATRTKSLENVDQEVAAINQKLCKLHLLSWVYVEASRFTARQMQWNLR